MPRSISPHALMKLVGSADCPRIVDVRRAEIFRAAPARVPGAFWRGHLEAREWGPTLARRGRLVVYCAHGHTLSALAASLLRADGIEVAVLEGGMAAYVEAGGIVVPPGGVGIEPGLPRASVWVTRERPKIDRIACPWLIRRFIDPLAEFHFVLPEWVRDVADELRATPFDVDGVHYSHRGDACSFDTFLAEFGLEDAALLHLARIVRGADTARFELEPECAGLLALSLGLSAVEADDIVQLDKGMLFYDALYGWCRHARGERHVWQNAA